MSDLDDRMRDALRRVDPPSGFAERVLERLPASRPNVVALPARNRTAPRFALAAAAALAVAAGSAWLAIPRGALGPAPESVGVGAKQPEAPDIVPRVEPPAVAIVTPVNPTSPPRPRRRTTPRAVPSDAEAIRAAEQLMLALQITGDKLNVARHEVRATLTVPES